MTRLSEELSLTRLGKRDRERYWNARHAARRLEFDRLRGRVILGLEEITPELMKSVTRPDWKRELVEAICLAKVRPKEEK